MNIGRAILKYQLPTINTGVDYQRFRPTAKKNYEVNLVGYIGRILKRKGVYIFWGDCGKDKSK